MQFLSLNDNLFSSFANFINTNSSWIFSGIGTEFLKVFMTLVITFLILIFKPIRNFITENLKGISLGIAFTVTVFWISQSILIQGDAQNARVIEAAFNKIFGSDWFEHPYANENKDIDKHCFKYQGTWNLYKSEQNEVPYFFDFSYRIGDEYRYIYYVANSVTAYAWCKLYNSNGDDDDQLEMIEFLINDVYLTKDSKKANTDNFDEFQKQTFLIGKIGGLYTDSIHFLNDKSSNPCPKPGEPCYRIGKRIGRYNLGIEDSRENNFSASEKEEILKLIRNYIRNLKPSCDVSMASRKKTRNENFKLKLRDSIMSFDCVLIYYDEILEKERKIDYTKELIFNRKWHHKM